MRGVKPLRCQNSCGRNCSVELRLRVRLSFLPYGIRGGQVLRASDSRGEGPIDGEFTPDDARHHLLQSGHRSHQGIPHNDRPTSVDRTPWNNHSRTVRLSDLKRSLSIPNNVPRSRGRFTAATLPSVAGYCRDSRSKLCESARSLCDGENTCHWRQNCRDSLKQPVLF